MSFLSSFFSGSGNQQATQQSGQSQNQQQPPSNTQQSSNNQQQSNQQTPSNNPAAPSQNAGSNGPADPAQLYAKMWDNSTRATEPPKLQIDDRILGQVTEGLDFMKGVDPELMQKATSGDMQSLMQLLQHQGRQIYATAMKHQAAVTDAYVGQRDQFNSNNLSSSIKRELTLDTMFSGLKNLPDFAKQQLKDTALRFQQANPDASPAEVQQAVQDYMKQMAGFVTPSSGREDSNKDAPGSVDWDNWLSPTRN